MPRARVRCPAERCAAIFEVSDERLGRNVYCLSCGTRMTARPVEVEDALVHRERRVGGSAGDGVRRLPLVALLDDIRSLWNVGSMFRTADACGVERLLLAGITGCPPRGEIAKTALGAEDAVAWDYRADALVALEEVRGAGYTPVALEDAAGAVNLAEMGPKDWPERRWVLVVGVMRRQEGAHPHAVPGDHVFSSGSTRRFGGASARVRKFMALCWASL